MRRVSILLMFAVACSPSVAEDPVPTDADTDVDSDTELGPAPDLTQRGEARSVVDTGRTAVRDDCELQWTRYSPDGEEAEVLVILSHGFARSQANMKGWAEHLSSWGAEVVTPDLCFARLIRTDHPANGRSIADLARELRGDRRVILAGHSAGGLASVLAADELGDDVAGVLLFDPVDNNDLGADASVSAPVGALFAAPGTCNSDGNGVAMVPQGELAFAVEGANHCSFESPSDRLCTSICGRDPGDEDGIRSVLLGMSAGFVQWHGGLDSRGEAWWLPGSERFADYPVEVTAK